MARRFLVIAILAVTAIVVGRRSGRLEIWSDDGEARIWTLLLPIRDAELISEVERLARET